MSKHYLIVSGSVADQEKITKYKEVAGPVMKKFNGVMPPENFEVTNILAGSLRPTFLLRIEFPDAQNIKDAFASEEYLAAIKNRDEGFSNLSIYSVKGD